MNQVKQFTRIKSTFSTNRRIPLLGKIRLGLKVETQAKAGGTTMRPKETEYFVVPPEVEEIYGKQPISLDVMFPYEDEEKVFPQKLIAFGSGTGMKCHGDGETAQRYNEQTKQWEERSCPCEWLKSDENPKGSCSAVAYLMVYLPRVSLGGVYQITTKSYHSVVDINSAIDHVRSLVRRIALVPLTLRRQARETRHDGYKQIHWTMTLTMDADVAGVNKLLEVTDRILEQTRLCQIEGPSETNPELDPVDVSEPEEPIITQEEKGKSIRKKMQAKVVETPPQQTQVGSDGVISDSQWADTIAWMKETDERESVMETVKKKIGVKLMASVLPQDREAFVLTYKDFAKKAGVDVGGL